MKYRRRKAGEDLWHKIGRSHVTLTTSGTKEKFKVIDCKTDYCARFSVEVVNKKSKGLLDRCAPAIKRRSPCNPFQRHSRTLAQPKEKKTTNKHPRISVTTTSELAVTLVPTVSSSHNLYQPLSTNSPHNSQPPASQIRMLIHSIPLAGKRTRRPMVLMGG
jgi:hypothetical protein